MLSPSSIHLLSRLCGRVSQLHYIPLITFFTLFLQITYQLHSFASVYFGASWLSPLSIYITTPLPPFSDCPISPSLTFPLSPSILWVDSKSVIDLALPHVARTSSGKPASSMSIRSWRVGATLIFFLFFLLLFPPAPILDVYSVHTLSISFFFPLVLGGVMRCVVGRAVAFHHHCLTPASHLPYLPPLSLGYPPLPPPSPAHDIRFFGSDLIVATWPLTLPPIDSLCFVYDYG